MVGLCFDPPTVALLRSQLDILSDVLLVLKFPGYTFFYIYTYF